MSFNDSHMHVDPSLDPARPINKGEDYTVLASGLRKDCEICNAAKVEAPKAAKVEKPVTTGKQPVQ